MGKNDIVFIGIAGIAAYFLLSGKGKDEGGSESGGFQIPDLTGGGTPGNVFNITFPDVPSSFNMDTKKQTSISGINPTYSATAGGSVYQAQAKVDPVLANIFKAQTPTQIQTIQNKASSPGRYFAPTPYVGTTKKQDTAASVSKKSGAPVVKTQFSSVRAW